MIIIRKKINNGLIIGQSHYRTEVIAVVVSVLSLISKEKKQRDKEKGKRIALSVTLIDSTKYPSSPNYRVSSSNPDYHFPKFEGVFSSIFQNLSFFV